MSGGFVWTGFDYRGEPTPYGWPSINSQFGIVDMCGYPKDNYYYYQAWWGRNPVLQLFPHWNWEQRNGETIRVWVHSNLEEVELFLNGRSLGSQRVQPLTHLEWQVQYEPGRHEELVRDALAEAAAGRLRPVIGQVFPLDRAADAHAALAARSVIGKTLLAG